MKELDADIGIMAFVLQFAPQDFVNIPKHGTIQYHPSLLPKYRGPSSINWPIIAGETKTGLTIFRPTDGLDEGAGRSCRRRRRSARTTRSARSTSTACSRWACRRCSKPPTWWWPASTRRSCRTSRRRPTRAGAATAEAKIDWAKHVDLIYNLIRGTNPAPGAWTTLNGKKLQLFDARKHLFRTFGAVKGKIGEVSEVTATSFFVTAQGGRIEVLKAKAEDGKKGSAAEVAAALGIATGTALGT